jgi:hypothetical protein
VQARIAALEAELRMEEEQLERRLGEEERSRELLAEERLATARRRQGGPAVAIPEAEGRKSTR